MKTTTPSTLVILLALTFVSGCGSAGLNLGFQQQKFNQESPDNRVEQIIPAWQEGEGPGIDPHKVVRGFAGQIYFITGARGLTSEVNGRVRIYVFDNQGPVEEQSKPIHQFDFEPAAWKAHLLNSKLGPAYGVFIPYTRPGRNMAACALRIRYTPVETGANGPVEGTPVFSQMVTLDLEGTRKPVDYDTVITPGDDKTEPGFKPKRPGADQQIQQADGIQQVSARGDPVGGRGVQTAGFDSPAGRHRDLGRVRLADFEAEPDAENSKSSRTRVGDDRLDFLGNEDVESLPIGQAEPHRLSDSNDAVADAPARHAAGGKKLQTYTIPIQD